MTKTKVIKIQRKATARDYARAAAQHSDIIGNHFDPAKLSAIALEIGIKNKVVKGYPGYKSSNKLLPGPVAGIINDVMTYPGLNDTERAAILKEFGLKPTKETGVAKAGAAIMGVAAAATGASIVKEVVGGNNKNKTQVADEIKPLEPVIEKAIQDVGKIPPKTLEEKLEVFNDAIVQPATGGIVANKSAGMEALGDAAVSFIGSLMDKKKNGEELPGIYDKIAEGGLKVEDKIRKGVQANVEANIGAFVTKNPLVIFGAVGLLLVLVFKKK